MSKVKSKLILYFASLSLFIAIFLGLFVFNSMKSSLILTNKKILEDRANDVANILYSINEINYSILESLEKSAANASVEAYIQDLNRINKFLSYNEHFISLGIGDTLGNLYYINPLTKELESIKISHRPYYTNALRGRRGFLQPSFSSIIDYHSRISVYSVPVRDANGNVIAVLVMVLDGDYLSYILDNISHGDTGYSYLIDSAGYVIYHPNKAFTEKYSNIFDLADTDSKYKGVVDLLREARLEGRGSSHYYFERNLLGAYSKVQNTNWYLFLAQDEKEIFEQINYLAKLIASYIFIILIMCYLIFLKLNKDIDTEQKIHLKEKEKLEHEATYDDLSGVYNRRFAIAFLEKTINLAKREGKAVSIAYVDLDNLKPINDELGHSKGDEAIVYIASTMKSAIRETDAVCRMGGDEFLIIFYNCSKENASEILVKISNKLEEAQFITPSGYKLEISYGVSEYDKNLYSELESFIEASDKSMYEQKYKKKNKGTSIGYSHRRKR